MTIKKGKATPKTIRIKPRLRRRRGWFMMADITNKPQNDSARVQNRVGIFRHTSPQSLLHNADGSGSLWAGSPSLVARQAEPLYSDPHCAHRGQRLPQAKPLCRGATDSRAGFELPLFRSDCQHTSQRCAPKNISRWKDHV